MSSRLQCRAKIMAVVEVLDELMVDEDDSNTGKVLTEDQRELVEHLRFEASELEQSLS